MKEPIPNKAKRSIGHSAVVEITTIAECRGDGHAEYSSGSYITRRDYPKEKRRTSSF